MKLPKQVSFLWVVVALILGYVLAKALCKCTGASAGRSSAYGATNYRAGQ